MKKQSHSLESLLLMVLIEMDPVMRFQTILKLDESIRQIEIQYNDSEVLDFVEKAKQAFQSFVDQGFYTFVITAKEGSGEAISLNVLGERKSYVFGHKRSQVDITC